MLLNILCDTYFNPAGVGLEGECGVLRGHTTLYGTLLLNILCDTYFNPAGVGLEGACGVLRGHTTLYGTPAQIDVALLET